MSNNIKFRNEIRGYNKNEVDTYIRMLQEGVIELEAENEKIHKTLNDKVEEMNKEKQALIEKYNTLREEKSIWIDQAPSIDISDIFERAQVEVNHYVSNVNEKIQEEVKNLAEDFIHKASNKVIEEEYVRIQKNEEELKEKYDGLCRKVQEELENAKAKAEEIKAQSALILEQAENQKKCIIQEAEEKAEKISNKIKTDFEQVRGVLMDSIQKYEDSYEVIEKIGKIEDMQKLDFDSETLSKEENGELCDVPGDEMP